jgi:3-deoxy-manno-octulosonate cytidylyltransferase (CMP-KDO synthetase)
MAPASPAEDAMSTPSFAIVLPARYDSTRFPGKPLAEISGRPLIEWVYRRATDVPGAASVVVATDDERIAKVVRAFGGNVTMTRAEHRTGTDRVAEVAASLHVGVVVNLQGDEPVFDPSMVVDMVGRLGADSDVDIVTACHPIENEEDFGNPNVVKVVVDARGRALYFSRSPIPSGGAPALRHVGVYAFRREALERFASLEPTPLEVCERLEQLRALENGMTIGVIAIEKATAGVDVPSDIKNVEKEIGKTYTS